MQKFSAPTPDTVNSALFNGSARTSHFQIFDSMAEFLDFARAKEIRPGSHEYASPDMTDNTTHDAAQRLAAAGDMRLAAEAERYLARFENAAPASFKSAWFDSINGALPNVPAFVSGSPLNMRSRRRVQDEAAPITVCVDVGANSGVTPQEVSARGAAILALVRALASRRPVDLWACCGLDADSKRNASWTFVQIETRPLDLARAAFIFAHPAAVRHLFWSAAMPHGFQAFTPYGAAQKHRHHTADLIAPAFPNASEVLAIGRAHSDDESTSNPAAWLEKQLAAYCPEIA